MMRYASLSEHWSKTTYLDLSREGKRPFFRVVPVKFPIKFANILSESAKFLIPSSSPAYRLAREYCRDSPSKCLLINENSNSNGASTDSVI